MTDHQSTGDYDFAGLTLQQQTLLTYGGWRRGDAFQRQPSIRTAARLIARGLLVKHEVTTAGMRYSEYEVPHAVHIAWCEHCKREGMIL